VKKEQASLCLDFSTQFTTFPCHWTDQALWNLLASFITPAGNCDEQLPLLGANKFRLGAHTAGNSSRVMKSQLSSPRS
jgi:hypothetical protein